MTNVARLGVSAAAFGCAAVLLSGCMGSSRVATSNLSQPETLKPLGDSTVASSNLPAVGADGQVASSAIGTPAGAPVDPALSGQPVLGGQMGDPVQTANADGSFVTLDAVGSISDTPGRDLSGGLTVQKLLGGWTIVSGADQCKLNLTQTTKSGTSRYRASTPACSMAGLKVVASWQLAGSQVQLFDENGDMIAALILSGNRFIGTLAGGQGISMVG